METKEFQRWTARRKVELLLQLIRGERQQVFTRKHAARSGGTVQARADEPATWATRASLFANGGHLARALRGREELITPRLANGDVSILNIYELHEA